MINKLGFGFLHLPKKGEELDWQNIDAMTDTFLQGGRNFFDTCYAGVDSVWAGVHEPEKTRDVFGLPETMIPICFIDLGFRPEGFKGNRDHSKRNPVEAMVTRL